jgi:hypothetical protein
VSHVAPAPGDGHSGKTHRKQGVAGSPTPAGRMDIVMPRVATAPPYMYGIACLTARSFRR